MKSSICYESILILVSFTWNALGRFMSCMGCHCTPSQGTLSGANILDIFDKESTQKTKVLENLFNLPWHLWIYPRQLMGSVPSIRVEGNGLNATVGLLPKVEEERFARANPYFLGFFIWCSIFTKSLKLYHSEYSFRVSVLRRDPLLLSSISLSLMFY